MNYTISFLLKAWDEFQGAWTWYEEQQDGLGNKFEQDFFDKIDLIQSNPLHYPIKSKFQKNSYREARLNIFPFIVIYRVFEEEKRVFIYSVFHTSRNQKKKTEIKL